mgnify:CR=1 FL=1
MNTVKQFILTLALISLTTGVFAQIKVGGGLSFGTGPDNLALQVRSGYQFNSNLTAMIDANFYMEGDKNFRARTLNFNLQYHFLHQENVSIYGLGGLNLTHVADVYHTDFGMKIVDPVNGTAFNLGAGGRYAFNENIDGFFEAKYIIGDFDQFVVGIGVVYNLNLNKG